MIALRGVIQNGQVGLPQPAELADGTEVTVLSNGRNGTLGIPDDQWPSSPEEIARMIAHMEQVEPFEMSSQEEADFASWRQHSKEYSIAKQNTEPRLFE